MNYLDKINKYSFNLLNNFNNHDNYKLLKYIDKYYQQNAGNGKSSVRQRQQYNDIAEHAKYQKEQAKKSKDKKKFIDDAIEAYDNLILSKRNLGINKLDKNYNEYQEILKYLTDSIKKFENDDFYDDLVKQYIYMLNHHKKLLYEKNIKNLNDVEKQKKIIESHLDIYPQLKEKYDSFMIQFNDIKNQTINHDKELAKINKEMNDILNSI